MISKRKVVLVGTGFVGMSMAYALENQGGVNELVLIDVLKDKAVGEAMDLAHGIACAPSSRIEIKAGEYSECKDADIVVITAGIAQKPGQTRLELAKTNAGIMKDITEQVVASGFNGIFVIATNPVDLMTYVVEKVSKFPKNKVIGSGTMLDTSRLRYLIGERLDISPKNVHAYIMGEHGDSSFVAWSHSYVGCKPLIQILKEKGKDEKILDEIYTDVQQAAYEIINRKKATYYGIGLGLTKIVKTILDDEKEILTVSSYIDGNYGHSGLFIGVPTIIGGNGAEDILNITLSEDEQAKFDASFDVLEKMKEDIDKVL